MGWLQSIAGAVRTNVTAPLANVVESTVQTVHGVTDQVITALPLNKQQATDAAIVAAVAAGGYYAYGALTAEAAAVGAAEASTGAAASAAAATTTTATTATTTAATTAATGAGTMSIITDFAQSVQGDVQALKNLQDTINGPDDAAPAPATAYQIGLPNNNTMIMVGGAALLGLLVWLAVRK